jgi:glycine dehydrogenase subunit 1
MPFIPHTEQDIRAMLKVIGVAAIEDLFDEIPASLRSGGPGHLPPAMGEMEITRLMHARAEQDGTYLSFLGAGAYEHHIPAAVWQIATRGEFYSAYTPYQAEASQGTLQLLYEYQSMIASLSGMDATNASLYDGATALAEAVLMAVRAHKTSRRVLIPRTVHPVWRKVVNSMVRNQAIELIDLEYDAEAGCTQPQALAKFDDVDIAALVVPQPNFFGVLEPVHGLTDWAHAHGALVIAVVNPTALSILKPPGEWGEKTTAGTGGADIAVGEGQPLGIPLSGGGPYLGIMACRKALLRQMPGRIVGRTTDLNGKSGYVLTLQAREQHIRRSRATSNICTNQGLAVTAAAIYMSLLGPAGLAEVARASHANARTLQARLSAIDGVEGVFNGPIFHEFVLRVKTPLAPVLRDLKAQGILGGHDLAQIYPELGQSLLVCATETKSSDDLGRYAEHMARIVGKRFRPAPHAHKPKI